MSDCASPDNSTLFNHSSESVDTSLSLATSTISSNSSSLYQLSTYHSLMALQSSSRALASAQGASASKRKMNGSKKGATAHPGDMPASAAASEVVPLQPTWQGTKLKGKKMCLTKYTVDHLVSAELVRMTKAKEDAECRA